MWKFGKRNGKRRIERGGVGARVGNSKAELGKSGWVMEVLKSLLISYILTVALLAILAFLLYKTGLTEKVVAVAIILIYVAATFCAGFLTGKKVSSRKFAWGLLMGAVYFVVLAVVSLIANQSPETLGDSFFTTMVLCCGGGMLGGMLS